MPAKEEGIQSKKDASVSLCTNHSRTQPQWAGAPASPPLPSHLPLLRCLVEPFGFWGVLFIPGSAPKLGSTWQRSARLGKPVLLFPISGFHNFRDQMKILQPKEGKNMKERLELREKLWASEAVRIVPRTFPRPLKVSPGPLSFVFTKPYNR